MIKVKPISNINKKFIQEIFLITLLASIWGASFLFMRILATALPPIIMANLRILIAGLFVLLYIFIVNIIRYQVLKLSLLKTFDIKDIKKNFIGYLAAGSFNSAIPFILYSFAEIGRA